MNLPLKIDLTPEGELKECASFGEEGYGENVEYSIRIDIQNGMVFIDYYGEDDTLLSEVDPSLLMEIFEQHNPDNF